MHIIKKKKKKSSQAFKLQRVRKVFPDVGEKALFWRGHYECEVCSIGKTIAISLLHVVHKILLTVFL